VVDTDRGNKETIRFYDTEGISLADDSSEIAIPKQYHALADGFVLVYAIENRPSFEMVDLLRKDIERNKEKKEVINAKAIIIIMVMILFWMVRFFNS
jgi:NF-kappa-B inhibitor-interacting Ras-like protein